MSKHQNGWKYYGVLTARWGLAAIILVCLVVYLVRGWSELQEVGEWHVRWGLVAASAAVLVVAYAGLFSTWHLSVHLLGGRPALVASLRAYFISQLAKYVPGKVMTVVSRALALEGHVPAGTSVAACVVEVLALCASAAVVAMVCLPFVPQLAAAPGLRYVALGAPLGLALMHPRLLERGLNIVARRLKRREVRFDVPYRRLLLVPLAFVVPWVLLGLHIHLLCLGLSAGNPPFALSVGANTASWVGGFLLFFAPGGLGVREGLVVLLLGLSIPQAGAAAVALVSRLMLTACELLATGALSWHHRKLVRAALAAADEAEPPLRGTEGLAT